MRRRRWVAYVALAERADLLLASGIITGDEHHQQRVEARAALNPVEA